MTVQLTNYLKILSGLEQIKNMPKNSKELFHKHSICGMKFYSAESVDRFLILLEKELRNK